MQTNSLPFPLLSSRCDVIGFGATMARRSPVAGETVRGCPHPNTFGRGCGGVGPGMLCRALMKQITSSEIVDLVLMTIAVALALRPPRATAPYRLSEPMSAPVSSCQKETGADISLERR